MDRSGDVVPALLGQFPLQLWVRVEVILDRPLGPTRDEHQVRNARRDRLLNGILDDRLVDDRQQLLRHSLCGGQEACPKPRDGEDGLGNRCHRELPDQYFRRGCKRLAGPRSRNMMMRHKGLRDANSN